MNTHCYSSVLVVLAIYTASHPSAAPLAKSELPPQVDDIQQGSIGDCYFLAALATVVHHHPTITDDLIDETYEEQGIYGVSFHTGRQWQVCVRVATGTLPAARE